jgi:hypothetical protein
MNKTIFAEIRDSGASFAKKKPYPLQKCGASKRTMKAAVFILSLLQNIKLKIGASVEL